MRWPNGRSGWLTLFRVVMVLLAVYTVVVWLAAGRPDPTPFLLGAGGFLVAMLGVRFLWPDDGRDSSLLVGYGLTVVGIGTCFWAGTLGGGGSNSILYFMLVIVGAVYARRCRERDVLRAG